MKLSDIVDKIQGYNQMLQDGRFVYTGSGIKPWSQRHENEEGEAIEIRASGWTFYNKNGKAVLTGTDPKDLQIRLLKRMSKEELINLIIK